MRYRFFLPLCSSTSDLLFFHPHFLLRIQVMASSKSVLQKLRIVQIAVSVLLFACALFNDSFFGFECSITLRVIYAVLALALTPLATMGNGVSGSLRASPVVFGVLTVLSAVLGLTSVSSIGHFWNALTCGAHFSFATVCALTAVYAYQHLQASTSSGMKRQ